MVGRFRQDAHRGLAPFVVPSNDYVLNWWPLMRHYGAPTRLLDWSLSPYVALYFAVEEPWDEDGALWWYRANIAENLMVRKFGAAYKDHERSVLESTGGDVFV
jgi:hypothetical protein